VNAARSSQETGAVFDPARWSSQKPAPRRSALAVGAACELAKDGVIPESERQAWIERLVARPLLCRFILDGETQGVDAKPSRLLALLGEDLFLELELEPDPRKALMRLAFARPEAPREIEAFVEANGPNALREALATICSIRSRWPRSSDAGERISQLAIEKLPLERMLAVVPILLGDALGTECFMHEHGADALLRSMLSCDLEALALELARVGAGFLVEGGRADRAFLKFGAAWPALDPPRTEHVARSEISLLEALDLPADALTPLGRLRLSAEERSRIARSMLETIAARRPDLLDKMSRELDGRRFISFKYYDPLYLRGISNPEHRYSVDAFAWWKTAETWIMSKARASRGRALEPGEFLSLLRGVHRRAGCGAIDPYGCRLETASLGQFRAKAKPAVVTGVPDGRLTVEHAAMLDANPYLDHDVERSSRPDGTIHQSQLKFARGDRVDDFMNELDRWVRAEESRTPPLDFASEVQFRLISIHPFFDAIGRAAKLMVDFFLDRAGIVPPIQRGEQILIHRERWPTVLLEGVSQTAHTIERYYRVAVADGTASSRRRAG
jgi:Fic/DOC family protein